MSISIHHGSNGSYKTSGVIQDYLYPAMKEGRTVVTNIRGVSTDNCFDVYDDCHSEFNVINIDTDTKEGRYKILTFWHWVPLGALLLFDEAGVMFPKRLRESDLSKLTLENADDLGRPRDWIEAWEMHRHYNWDIVLSCPNIKSVRSDIRDTSEGAYKHRNNNLIGLPGSYNEGFHKAEDNGTSPLHFITTKKKKIHADTFKLYKSTKTGEVQDSQARSSLLDNGRLLMALGILASAIGYNLYAHVFSEQSENSTRSIFSSSEARDTLANQKSISPPSSDVGGGLGHWNSLKSDRLEPFNDYEIKLLGEIYSQQNKLYAFELSSGDYSFYLNSNELRKAGYSIRKISTCAIQLVFNESSQVINCKGKRKEVDRRGVPEAPI